MSFEVFHGGVKKKKEGGGGGKKSVYTHICIYYQFSDPPTISGLLELYQA